MIPVGTIKSLHRYPVKSMAGEDLASAELGWHGIDGDRRYSFIRKGDLSGFPWLTASKLRELILYKATFLNGETSLHVRTPDGTDFDIKSPELLEHLTEAYGGAVELVRVSNGIFDDSPVSLISTATISMLERETGRPIDVRRFRPNIVVESLPGYSPQEESWVGNTLVIGNAADAPAVRVTTHDVRCVMVNLDPDTAVADPIVLKTIARTRRNCAGVYGSTFRAGTIALGDRVYVDDHEGHIIFQ